MDARELGKAWSNVLFGVGGIPQAIEETRKFLSSPDGKRTLINALGNAIISRMADRIVAVLHREKQEQVITEELKGHFRCPYCQCASFTVQPENDIAIIFCAGDKCSYRAPFSTRAHWTERSKP